MKAKGILRRVCQAVLFLWVLASVPGVFLIPGSGPEGVVALWVFLGPLAVALLAWIVVGNSGLLRFQKFLEGSDE